MNYQRCIDAFNFWLDSIGSFQVPSNASSLTSSAIVSEAIQLIQRSENEQALGVLSAIDAEDNLICLLRGIAYSNAGDINTANLHFEKAIDTVSRELGNTTIEESSSLSIATLPKTFKKQRDASFLRYLSNQITPNHTLHCQCYTRLARLGRKANIIRRKASSQVFS